MVILSDFSGILELPSQFFKFVVGPTLQNRLVRLGMPLFINFFQALFLFNAGLVFFQIQPIMLVKSPTLDERPEDMFISGDNSHVTSSVGPHAIKFPL